MASVQTPARVGFSIEPYLFFEGRADEAVEFYKQAAGAEVIALLRFKDGPGGDPGSGCAPGQAPPADKVMHGLMKIAGASVMFSDGMCSGKPSFQGIGLTLNVPDAGQALKYFNAMSEGGQVMQAPQATFFSDSFCMFTDKFGVMWMVVSAQVQQQQQQQQ